jgi:L-Ala-D/L-Glu epimerase
MRVVSVRWSTYCIPLRDNFITAHRSMAVREGAIIELFTSRNDIVGIGEIAPLPDFGSCDLDEALAALSSLVNELRGKTIEEALEYLQALLFSGRLPAPTACGMEIALLDALGKTRNCSVSRLLNLQQYSEGDVRIEAEGPVGAGSGRAGEEGPLRLPSSPPRPYIPVNAVIGAQDITATVQQARQMAEAGFTCLKIKMGKNDPRNEIERVKAVREAIGPSIQLRLDANEGWTFEQALTILTACTDWHIQYVEQPLPSHDINGMRELQHAVSIPLAADEAVHDLNSIRTLLRAQAAQVMIIKPQLAGGLRASREMLRLANQNAIRCVITSAFEAGIGLAATLHLVAASPEITWACGLATLDRLVDDLLCEDLPVLNGMIAVPTAPGLGVTLDQSALLQYRHATGEM